jgi:hypothetical protein
MLFLCSGRDVFANFGKHLLGDAEERGEVIRIMGITQEAIRSTRYRIQQNGKK